MKVMLVEYFGRGGIAHYTHCLAQALAGQGIRTALCTEASFEFGRQALSYELHKVFNIYGDVARQSEGANRPKLSKGLGYLQGCLRLDRVTKEVAPDVIHIQSSSLLPLAELGLVAWLRGRAHLVYTIHNLMPHEVRRHHRRLYAHVYRLPQALIAHGEAVKSDLHRQFRAITPVHVIPHGEYSFLSRPDGAPSRGAARARLGIPGDTPVILFFGAIRAYKGLDTLLEAMPEVVNILPTAQIWIVGKPQGDFDSYQIQIEKLGLNDHIKTRLEYVPQQDIPLYFAAANVVALPYKRTYQSGVVQLAYAAARPVVTTLTGALPEVVEDGQSGLLVAPNDPHALAQALVRLLRDPLMAKRMGEYGRDLAEKCFSWDAIARQTVQVYQEIQRQK